MLTFSELRKVPGLALRMWSSAACITNPGRDLWREVQKNRHGEGFISPARPMHRLWCGHLGRLLNFSADVLVICPTKLTGAFYAGNFSGMIHVITSNVIIPATPSNPSIPYVKRTSKSRAKAMENWWNLDGLSMMQSSYSPWTWP